MKKFLSACLSVCLFSTLIGRAEVKKTIIAAADPYIPFVDPGNPGGGVSLEIIRAAMEYQGYEIRYKNVPWKRAVVGVNESTYDILPDGWMSEERKKTQIYSDSYAANELKFIKRKGDPFEFNGIKSLSDKKIGTIIGYSYSKTFDNASNFTKEPVPRIMQNIKKLVYGRIDLTLDDEIMVKAELKKNNPDLINKIEFTKNSISSKPLYISCSKKNPKCKEIINAFNKGLKKIKSDGTYNKILSKYGMK